MSESGSIRVLRCGPSIGHSLRVHLDFDTAADLMDYASAQEISVPEAARRLLRSALEGE